VFSALHDQLASLGRHAQLTRCFSAVAELLVVIGWLSTKRLCSDEWSLSNVWMYHVSYLTYRFSALSINEVCVIL